MDNGKVIMPSGPKIPVDLRKWIIRKAQDLPPRKPAEIHAEMVDWLTATYPNFAVPGLDAVRKIVNNARRVKSQFDDPWSLGACESFNIPQDATADLLAIWKRSIIGDTTFTIRQAIWAARLRQAVSDTPTSSRLEELRYWAAAYAADQRVAEALKTPLDTRELDSNLVFRTEDGSFAWTSWLLASRLGAVPRVSGLVARDRDRLNTLTEKVGADQALELLFERGTEADSEQVQELRKMMSACSTGLVSNRGITQQWEDLVLLLLRRIRLTERWQAMSEGDRIEVVQRLVEPPLEQLDLILENLGFNGIISPVTGAEGAS